MAETMSNEAKMKSRGEERVWKAIMGRNGAPKKVPRIQLGQQLIFSDALRVLPHMRDWIENKIADRYKGVMRSFFADDDILLQKITETLLLLAASSYVTRGDTSKKIYTRHKNVNTINKKVMPGLDFDMTWRFLEVLVEASAYFEVERTVIVDKDKPLTSLRYVCSIDEDISYKLAQEASLAFFPEPMLEPPVDWSYSRGKLVGGYKTYQYELIRANSFTVNYNKYSKNIFDAVNYIQSTPWRVNVPVMMAVKSNLKVPQKDDFVISEYPDDSQCEFGIDLKSDELELSVQKLEEIKAARAVFSEKLGLYNAELRDYESAVGKYRAVRLALGIAERYSEYDRIYFPHSYDFRGRVYPLPVGLSPQGSDAIKAMLEYADGEKLNKQGEDWAWAYLASLYGDDKIPFRERIERGKELFDADYREADEPYQFLAHQLELKKYVDDMDYEFKGRIHLDACNSGSQFTSAITGDVAGCMATNVIPTINEDGSQSRQDAYLLVADKAKELTERWIRQKAKKEIREEMKFFKKLLQENGRKICKTPVMVSNYGGTAGGRAEILWNMLRELGCDRKWITKKNASLFAKIIGDSISGVLNGGKAFETYIHQMNNIIAKRNRPVTWTTSDGFFVVHTKNKELKPKQVKCLLPGARKATIIYRKVYSQSVSPAKMKSAISPNYIHSLDAELLRRTALKMKEAGIVDSDWIHDSFGCHPNYVDRMLFITKDEFRKLIQRGPLKILDMELRAQAGSTKPVLKKLEEVQMPQFEGFDPELEVIYDSDWFFS